MFFDERIEMKKSKLFKSSIIITMVVSLYFLVMKSIEKISISNNIVELIVLFSGTIIILIDLFKYNNKNDERIAFNKSQYYKKVIVVFIALVLLGFAITIGITNGLYTSHIYAHLLTIYTTFVIISYITFSLKRDKITYNYKIIFKNNREYYLKVIINMAYMIVLITVIYLIGFIISAILVNGLVGIMVTFFTVLKSYLITLTIVVIAYLFISITEKIFYDTEEKNKSIFKLNLIYFIIIIFLNIASVIINIKINKLNMNSSYNLGARIEFFSYFLRFISMISKIMTIFLLGNILYDLDHYKNKVKGINLLVVAFVLGILLDQLSSVILTVFVQKNEYNLIVRYMMIHNKLLVIPLILNMLGFIFIGINVVDRKYINSVYLLMPIVYSFFTIIIIFLMISPINASVLLVVLLAVNTMLFALFLLLIKNDKKTNTLSGNF